MSKSEMLTDPEIRALIKAEHRWELKKGILICFGIEPSSFDWEADANSDPVRVYNWCCHVLNGGEHEYRRGQPKLTPVNHSGEPFAVLRDKLIPFAYIEWPDFIQETYKVWKAYRAERDGKPMSALQKQCIYEMKMLAIHKFKQHKYHYLHGQKLFTKEQLANELSEKIGKPANTIRTYCSTFNLSRDWLIENEIKDEYQSIS